MTNTFLRVTASAAIALIATTGMAGAEAVKPAVISVSATGSANVAPDMAVLNLAVQKEGKTARQALDANNAAMTRVLAALKETGIAERDLQTANFNIQPRYHYPKSSSNGGQKPPQIVGYLVSNSLTVRIRDLSRLGVILDKSVTLGVNSGGNVQFTTDNPIPIVEKARANAMARAIAKAKTLTKAAGVRLGRILEISEQSHQPPQPRSMARMEMAVAKDAAVPMASGENAYSVTVNVRWEINQ